MPCCSAMRRIHLSLLMLIGDLCGRCTIVGRALRAHPSFAAGRSAVEGLPLFNARNHPFTRRPTMRAATDLLSRYAEYHRDQRNIASHFVGVPMIVFALGVLFARPAFMLGHVALSPAWVLFGPAAAWYLTRGSIVLGTTVAAGTAALLLAA